MSDEDYEEIMKRWDVWRVAIAQGDAGSWPRDEFEMLLGGFIDRISELEGQLEIANRIIEIDTKRQFGER